MNKALQATQVALEREKKLTALTGVVAALGHELGSPLATIKLASSELLSELDHSSPIYQDIQLIFDQIERCKAIITDMGSFGKDDQYVKIIDFFTLLFEASQPYKELKKKKKDVEENLKKQQKENRKQADVIFHKALFSILFSKLNKMKNK